MMDWSTDNGVYLDFIQPGKPMENAICESFNGRFRDEWQNENGFADIEHSRDLIESWREDYNGARPHGALGTLTPREVARLFNAKVSA